MNLTLFTLPKPRSLAVVPVFTSMLAILTSVLALLAWWLHLPGLAGPRVGLATMSPVAAVGFALAGIALYLMRTPRANRSSYRLGQICSAGTGLLGLALLLEFVFGWPIGLERLIASAMPTESGLDISVRASFHTGLALFLIGSALLFLDVKLKHASQLAQVLAVLGGCVGLLALIGYLVQNSVFYNVDRNRDAGMTLLSSLLSSLLGLGILCARPKTGVVAVIISAGGGGVLARRLLFVPLALPLLLVFVTSMGQRTGLFSRDFGAWLSWFGYLTAFMCIIWWVAGILQKAERERSGQERRMRLLNNELVQTNKELEAFSYSVSHDLRAPLRAIDGFSRILQEECANMLEGEYIEYLNDIRHNAQQMGQLIDALLKFARLSRQPLHKHQVPVDEIVHECLEYLEDATAQGKLQLTVRELPACEADRSLLKQVWQNLIDNALKYSRHRNPSIVEIGCTATAKGGAQTYYVRDNGTGFDMAYAGKLFGVFQRLHRAEDFEGTGVGLAVVQRVLQRHGGRVWAEAQPEKGATFYFSLSESGTGE
jgi:signal transduction histidine kinase